MALKSMTGYGRGVARGRGIHVDVEISSVNRRQLDVQISLPPALRILEPRVQDEVTRAASRGRIMVDVGTTEAKGGRDGEIRLNEHLARTYLQNLRAAARKLGLPDDLSARTLLQLPGVLTYAPAAQDVEAIWPMLQRALRAAVRQFLAMRQREGRALQAALSGQLGCLGRLVQEIRKASPGVAERYRRTLAARLRQLGLGEMAVDDRVARELVLFADKSDIAEELTRLDSHLEGARGLLQSAEAAGRALDFLAQEMQREINTIGSKANDAAITGHVVAFKTELERFREQVQNIE